MTTRVHSAYPGGGGEESVLQYFPPFVGGKQIKTKYKLCI